MLKKLLLTLMISTTAFSLATAVVATNKAPVEIEEVSSSPYAATIMLLQTIETQLTAKEATEGLTKSESRKLRKVKRKISKLEAAAAGGKNWIAALLFSIFLGGLAIDRFYLGYVGLGILKLLTFAGFGIWYIVDVILIATRSLEPKNGYYDEDSF